MKRNAPSSTVDYANANLPYRWPQDTNPKKETQVEQGLDQTALEQAYQQVETLYAEKQWGAVIAQAQVLLQRWPTHAPTYKLVGTTLYRQGRLNAAREVYQIALVHQPDFTEVHINLGNLAAHMEAWTDAITHYQDAIALNPDFAGAYRNLAQVWQKVGNDNAATECWLRAYELEPDWGTATNQLDIGQRLAQQGRVKEAIATCEKAVLMDPDLVDAHLQLASLYQQQDQDKQAMLAYAKVVALQPDHCDAAYKLGCLLAQYQQTERAIACFEKLITLEPDNGRGIVQLRDIQLAQGHFSKALPYCQQVVEQCPDDADALFKWGGTLAQLKQWQEALVPLQQSVALVHTSAPVLDCLGTVLMNLDRWQDAETILRQAIHYDPNYSWAHHNLGNTLAALEEYSEAIAELEHAIALNPQFVRSYENLARIFAHLQEWDKALDTYRGGRSVEPTSPSVTANIAADPTTNPTANLTSNLTAQIIHLLHRQLQTTSAKSPQRVSIYQVLADEWIRAGETDEAIAAYQAALGIDPDHRAITLALAQLLRPTDPPRAQILLDWLQDSDNASSLNVTDIDQLQDRKRVKVRLAMSHLFDRQYYQRRYGLEGGDDALEHFLTVGSQQNYSPNPLFDTAYYKQQNPDVVQRAVNPLAHYLTLGYQQNCHPHPLFKTDFYWQEHKDVAIAQMCPLEHFLTFGAKEGRVAFSEEQCVTWLDGSGTEDAEYLALLPSVRDLLENKRPILRRMDQTNVCPSASDLDGHVLASFAHPTSGTLFIGKSLAKTRQGGMGSDEKDLTGLGIGIFCSSLGNYFIAEIADFIGTALEQAGHQVQRLTELDEPPTGLDRHVIVAPHEFFYLGKGLQRAKQINWWSKAVMVNVEQPQTPWFSRAFHFLRRSPQIFDISVTSAAILHQMGLDTYWLPLGYLDNYAPFNNTRSLPDLRAVRSLNPQIRQTCPALDAPLSERPLDLHFVGTLSRRRSHFFTHNARWLSQYRCFWHIPPINIPLVKGQGQALDTDTMVGLSRRSKILLNVHRDNYPYFEWHRMIFFGLWQNTLVLTEPCHDMPGLEANVHYIACPREEMEAKIHWLLHTSEGQAEAEQIRQAGHQALKETVPAIDIMERMATVMRGA